MINPSKRPTFFIVGAPRCGTTALNYYLKQHPQIFMPRGKEIHYFATDFMNLQKLRFANDDEYLQIFEGAPEETLVVGEASPFSLFSRTALQNMYKFNPGAKIIVTFRNPVEFVQSLHQLNFSLRREDEEDLAKAWKLQSVRKQGRSIPKSARHVELLMYGELGMFGSHLERVYALFPRDQVKVLFLDDLRTNPREVYEKLLAFLDVPSDGRTDFQPRSAGYKPRNRLVSKLMHPPEPVLEIGLKILSLFGVGFVQRIKSLHWRVEKLNMDFSPREVIDPALKSELRKYFQADIMKLSKLTGRDLSGCLE